MVLPALLLIASVAAAGCSTAAGAREVTTPRTERTTRITAAQFGSTVKVRVGDVLVVERPADFNEWTVDFSAEVLRSLNTDEGRRTPPAAGWTFAVVARGTTDLAFTPRVSTAGAPNVPRFVLTVTAQ
jgi:hypothetical protein